MNVTVARNEKNHGIYEVHKAGCAHLNLRHMDVVFTHEAAEPVAFARRYAEGQDGILATTGPCVQRGKREVFGTV